MNKINKDIFYDIIKILIKDNKKEIFYFFIIFLIYNLIEFLCFSYLISLIINNLKSNNRKNTYNILYFFIFFTSIYVIVNYYKKKYEYKVVAIFQQQTRIKLIEILYKSNNIYYINENYNNYIMPIARLSGTIGNFIRDCLTNVLPFFIFIIILFIYLVIYVNYIPAILFLILNIIIIGILYFNLPYMIKSNSKFEKNVVNMEKKIVETCNNMDKIIYRGMINKYYNELKNNTIILENKQNYFNNNISKITTICKFILDVLIFSIIIYYLINNKINIKYILITITLLSLYKFKGDNLFSLMNMVIDTLGRKNTVKNNFDIFLNNYYESKNNKLKNDYNLKFNKIIIQNLYFKYNDKSTKFILNNINLELNFNKNKLIGIYGPSGFGKSTLVKLLIKLYKPNKGNIFIDDNNISQINSEYLKKNIIYINQEQKLFDSNIKENLLYGCNNCENKLEEIYKYDKLLKSFPKNLLNYKTGFSGNNLSGGQRQIINILNGLLIPSKILILDEPTSNLDVNTKKELINIILKQKNNKNGIIIITHDYSIKHIFDKIINIKDINFNI